MFKKRAGWLDRHTYDESIKVLSTLAHHHAQQSGRFEPAISSFLTAGDFGGLLDLELDYKFSDDPMHLYHARQALAFFEKFEPLRLPDIHGTKTLNAFRRFARSEVSCRLVNDRFCEYRLGTPMEYPFDVILTDARDKIARILGKAPSLADLDMTFGPGATVSTKKSASCFRVKLGEAPECSHELEPFVDRLLSQLPAYTLLHGKRNPVDLDSVDIEVRLAYGRLQFVPKDAKKFRTIIVEPGLNVLLQQGLGKQIRKRLLKKAGVDLCDDKRNQMLAKQGSVSNQLATVDFSSASDTIAHQLVAFLLPEDWSVLLSLARTGTVTYEGLLIPLEKFSSMGNSFTFELESLIFWALAWSCLRHLQLSNTDLSIFGDDLIIPSSAYHLCELVFSFCGFTINREKSFHEGPFRESCGGDFFLGNDIRPYFQKEYVSPESLFTLHNFYMRTFQFNEASLVRKFLHPDLIIFGPDGYGDGHLIGAWSPNRKRVKLSIPGKRKKLRVDPKDLGWDGCFFYSYRHVSPSLRARHFGDELLPSYSVYARGEGDLLEEPQTQSSPQEGLWADPKYFTVPGSRGYEKVSIYTQRRGVFLP